MSRELWIDVSLWQDPEMWDRTPPADLRGVIIKASQNNFRDPKYLDHHEGARRHGLKVGFYHFLDHRTSAESQAATFLDAVRGLKFSGPIVCDTEAPDKWDDPEDLGRASLAFLEALSREGLPNEIWHYTSRRVLKKFSADTLEALKKWPVWLASYWKRPPREGERTKTPEGFRLVAHQWTSSNLLETTRRWYDDDLDLNFVYPLEDSGCDPLRGLDVDRAWDYNTRQILDIATRLQVMQRTGADPWGTRRSVIEAVARWQHAAGLDLVDGKIGPNTRTAMGL